MQINNAENAYNDENYDGDDGDGDASNVSTTTNMYTCNYIASNIQ